MDGSSLPLHTLLREVHIITTVVPCVSALLTYSGIAKRYLHKATDFTAVASMPPKILLSY